MAAGAGVGLFLWKRPPRTPPVAVGDGAAGAGVVAGEAAAVASFFDRFFGVALAAGVALVTAAAALGLGLALWDRFFGLAEAVGLGLASWEYASGVAAIANRARRQRNVRIKHVFYPDFDAGRQSRKCEKGRFLEDLGLLAYRN